MTWGETVAVAEEGLGVPAGAAGGGISGSSKRTASSSLSLLRGGAGGEGERAWEEGAGCFVRAAGEAAGLTDLAGAGAGVDTRVPAWGEGEVPGAADDRSLGEATAAVESECGGTVAGCLRGGGEEDNAGDDPILRLVALADVAGVEEFRESAGVNEELERDEASVSLIAGLRGDAAAAGVACRLEGLLASARRQGSSGKGTTDVRGSISKRLKHEKQEAIKETR